MHDITVKAIEDVEPYRGPHEIPGIRFRAIRQALGVTAWGMNIIELDPRSTGYPEHDHTHDGQEEVYVVLSGEVVLQTGDATRTLHAGELARVPPEIKRKLVTHDQPARVLALGATAGQAYDPGKSVG